MSCKVFLQLFFYCSRGGGKSESRAPEFVCHTVYLSCIFLVVHYFWWLNFRCGANFRAPPSMSRAKTRPKPKTAWKNAKKMEIRKQTSWFWARKVGWYAWLSTDRCPPLTRFIIFPRFFFLHQAQLYMIVLPLFGDKTWSRKNNDKYAGIYFGGIL